MDYGKMTKDELISELKSLKAKVETFEYKQSEGEQRKSEERITSMAKILEESLNEIYIFDAKTLRFIQVNKGARLNLGYSAEELSSYTPLDLKPRFTPESFKKLIEPLVTGKKKKIQFTTVHRRKDDSLYDIEVHLQLSTFQSKPAFVAIILDITERKKSEERLLAIIDNSTAVIYLKDIEGRYIMINRLYETLFNLSRKKVIGKTDYDIFPEELAEAFHKNDRKVLKLGSPFEFEETALHADGLHTYISLKFPLSNTEGVIYGVCGISTDITDRRKMEKELIKAQKFESIGVFAGGIAHDFNNSLQTIMGYVSLAKLRTNPKDEIYGFLEEAGKAVLQSRDLTHQLLTFSKGGTPVKTTISISELLESATKLALSGSNVRHELIIPEGLWHIEADRGQLNQVISNLIINADHAMPEGGNIKIRAENINVIEKDLLPLLEGRYIKIAIEDHGTGISQKHQQRIFDPYFTTKQKGSGLGLATSYSIVKKHDGHITVESETGVGTTFYIYLPATQKELPKEPVTRKADGLDNEPLKNNDTGEPAASKGRVLVMDDEHTIRTLLYERLRILKYEVETVAEGSELIRLYEDARKAGNPFDAVIMDLTIPGGMGGKDAIKKLLEIDPEVKAIVSSGYANDPTMANYLKCGFKGVLVKPHEIHELDETLQKVITMRK